MIVELILFGIVSSVCSQSLHHMMTPEELHSIFSVKSTSEVPEYDVVPVSIVKSRKRRYNGLYINTQQFGQNVSAWLNPLEGILADENTPVHLLYENPYGGNYPQVQTYKNLLKTFLPKLYENRFHATTLSVNRHSNGKRSVTGFIGDSYIQPVPSHLMDHARRHRRSLNSSLEHESDDNYHIVRKIPKPEGFHYPQALTISNTTGRSKRDNTKEYPEIIYPEILVLVDYHLFKHFSFKWDDMILYILSFWNGVDMRYRDIVHPRVRFNIFGIVICMAPGLLPYQISGRYPGPNVDISFAMNAKSRWLYEMREFFDYENYDLAVTMTMFELCDTGIDCNILGVANLEGACTYRKVAFVHDRGGFGGIMTTAHEIGHAFGMKHDDRNESRCDDKLGNVMSPFKTNTPASYIWSECSLRDFQNFLTYQGECLTNRPKQQKPIDRFMPGMLMSLDVQCEMIVGPGVKASRVDDSVCTQLKCTKLPTFSLPEAADGSSCGRGKICLHGVCDFVTNINK